MIRTGYNPTSAPVVVDGEGRSIGGRDWGTYDSTDEVADKAIRAGDLIPVDVDIDTAANPSPAAQRAFQRTKEIKERAERVKPVPKPVLREAAIEGGLIEATDDPSVSDLRSSVAEATHVALPETDPKPKPRKRTSTQED